MKPIWIWINSQYEKTLIRGALSLFLFICLFICCCLQFSLRADEGRTSWLSLHWSPNICVKRSQFRLALNSRWQSSSWHTLRTILWFCHSLALCPSNSPPDTLRLLFPLCTKREEGQIKEAARLYFTTTWDAAACCIDSHRNWVLKWTEELVVLFYKSHLCCHMQANTTWQSLFMFSSKANCAEV